MSDLTNAGDSFHTNAMLDNILVAPDASCVGYRHPSAFVEAFRRSFGTTPKAWIVSLEKLNGVS
jgi:AraC-like DNA-binding protein